MRPSSGSLPTYPPRSGHVWGSARCVKQLRILVSTTVTADEGSSSEEEQPAIRWKEAIKSYKVRTADSAISKHVTWPHDVVYTVAAKAAAYDKMSLVLFINRYLIVMEGEKQSVKEWMANHLQDLMADTEHYGWEQIRAFYAMWLNELEQGRVSWDDDKAKLKFRWAIVWHSASTCSRGPHISYCFSSSTPIEADKGRPELQCPHQARSQGLPGLQSRQMYRSYSTSVGSTHQLLLFRSCQEVVSP